MYVAVKGGEQAIENSQALLADRRRGDRSIPELTIAQIREQMPLAVDRVMTEGSLHDRDLAARFWGPALITPTVCSTSRWPPATSVRSRSLPSMRSTHECRGSRKFLTTKD